LISSLSTEEPLSFSRKEPLAFTPPAHYLYPFNQYLERWVVLVEQRRTACLPDRQERFPVAIITVLVAREDVIK
jgi:hypothetical protein